MITLIMIDEDTYYAVFLQPPATSFLIVPNILLRTLFSNAPSILPAMCETKFYNHTKQAKLDFIYFNPYTIREVAVR
jgi:hypothetical protein